MVSLFLFSGFLQKKNGPIAVAICTSSLARLASIQTGSVNSTSKVPGLSKSFLGHSSTNTTCTLWVWRSHLHMPRLGLVTLAHMPLQSRSCTHEALNSFAEGPERIWPKDMFMHFYFNTFGSATHLLIEINVVHFQISPVECRKCVLRHTCNIQHWVSTGASSALVCTAHCMEQWMTFTWQRGEWR